MKAQPKSKRVTPEVIEQVQRMLAQLPDQLQTTVDMQTVEPELTRID